MNGISTPSAAVFISNVISRDVAYLKSSACSYIVLVTFLITSSESDCFAIRAWHQCFDRIINSVYQVNAIKNGEI